MTKNVFFLLVSTLFLVGCGGVDEEKLAAAQATANAPLVAMQATSQAQTNALLATMVVREPETVIVTQIVEVSANEPGATPEPTAEPPTIQPEATNKVPVIPTQIVGSPDTELEFGGPDRSGRCPTDGSMRELLGLEDVKPVFTGENVVWDSCKWNFQGTTPVTFPLPGTWQATYTQSDGTVITEYGTDGFTITAKGATIRYLGDYNTEDMAWATNACDLIVREYRFGISRIPAYETFPGVNIECTDWVQPEPAQYCPVNSLQAAALIGGDNYRYWTPPDWEYGAWVFRSGGSFHTLRHPGGPGWLDVWTAANGAVNVFTSDMSVLKELNFEEASFHCRPEPTE